MQAVLTVKCLENAVHSGDSGGVAPDSFMILRQLFDRLEDSKTGKVIDELQPEIPPHRYEEIFNCSRLLGKQVLERSFVKGGKPLNQDPFQSMLTLSWRPTLAYTGLFQP